MKKKIMALSAALALGLSPAASLINNKASQTVHAASYDQSEMRTFVRSTMAKYKVRGSVLVVKDGIAQPITYGYAWYGKRYGNGRSNIVYPTASLQKVITGAMIVQLINEKNNTNQSFSQYTKISRWYPNLKNANKISVGQLLTHTSGIVATGTEYNRGINYSEQGAIDWVINKINTTPENEPGGYYYNNANYMLLAGIIRKETNQSYQSNFNSRIVNKLGLTNTYLYEDIPSWKTDAISYIWRNKNYQDANYIKSTVASQIVGAGNLFTTPLEYYRILQGMMNGQILDSSDFHYLTHLASMSKDRDYSGGLYLYNNGNLKTAFGSIYNVHFNSWVQLTYDNQNGIIMFLNQTYNGKDNSKAAGYEILNHIKANTFVNK